MAGEPHPGPGVEDCPFCRLLDLPGSTAIVERWPDAAVLRPRRPVAEGHVLVVPYRHVPDAAADPEVSAAAMRRAAELAGRRRPCNIITSVGAEATQTVFHLHLHVVPRRPGDGLALPWDQASR